MPNFFVTFGSNHVHPNTGECLFKHYVRIPAPNKPTARRIVVHRLGSAWSMMYDEEQFAGQVEKYGLTEWVWEFPDPDEGKDWKHEDG